MPTQFCYCILVSQPPYFSSPFLFILGVIAGGWYPTQRYDWKDWCISMEGVLGPIWLPQYLNKPYCSSRSLCQNKIKSDKCSTRTMLHHDRTTNGFTQPLHHLCLRIVIGFLFELSLHTLALYQNCFRYATGRCAEQHDKPLVLC